MQNDGSSDPIVTVQVPVDLLRELDRVALPLSASRSCVMLQALRHYLVTEGAEVIEDTEALAELNAGQGIPADQVMAEIDAIIANRTPRAGMTELELLAYYAIAAALPHLRIAVDAANEPGFPKRRRTNPVAVHIRRTLRHAIEALCALSGQQSPFEEPRR